jgi:mannose-6-phosphate isomerase-like protein (cupin superfamily)
MSSPLIKGWNHNTLNWDECIDIYNTSIEESKNELMIKCDEHMSLYCGDGKLNPIVAKMKLPGFFVCHSANIHKKVQEVMKMVNATDAHIYFNITRKAGSFGLHHDDTDVVYWQCVGKVVVIIDDVEYLLKPGDMIKIPKYVKHNVVPITPRIGVSLSVI